MLSRWMRLLPGLYCRPRRLASTCEELQIVHADLARPKTQIEGYDEEGFTVNGVHLLGSVFALPNMVFLSKLDSNFLLTPEMLAILPGITTPIDLILFGTGERQIPLPNTISSFLRSNKIKFEVMQTFHACATFNILNMEDRQVAGLFISAQ